MSIISIGTAQFGLNYGIKNNFKQVEVGKVEEILDIAMHYGITTIDTAQLYGNSEIVLGDYFREKSISDCDIITKINQTNDIAKIVNDSSKRLNHKSLYGVLIHDFEVHKKNPLGFETLRKIKETQQIKKIGFTLYYPEDLELLFDNNVEFDIIQLPYSIFDRRFEKYFPILAEKNIEIHIRSVFLQGLFFLNPKELHTHFDKVKDKLENLHKLSKESGFSISSLCLNFVANNQYVDKIVIGIDCPEDLLANMNTLVEKQKVGELLHLLNQFSIIDLDILFPHFWKLT